MLEPDGRRLHWIHLRWLGLSRRRWSRWFYYRGHWCRCVEGEGGGGTISSCRRCNS